MDLRVTLVPFLSLLYHIQLIPKSFGLFLVGTVALCQPLVLSPCPVLAQAPALMRELVAPQPHSLQPWEMSMALSEDRAPGRASVLSVISCPLLLTKFSSGIHCSQSPAYLSPLPQAPSVRPPTSCSIHHSVSPKDRTRVPTSNS